MTPEMESTPPDVGTGGGGGGEPTTWGHKITSKSNSSNRVLGQVGQGCRGRKGHQGHGGQYRRFNCPSYISLISCFKWKVDDPGTVLGNTAKQREANDQYNKFSEKLKQYILRELHNPEDIIVMVWDLKYLVTVLNTSRPTELSTKGKNDKIIVMIQTE